MQSSNLFRPMSAGDPMLINNQPTTATSSLENTFFVKVLKTKVPIALISIITYILIATNNSIISSNVFILFLFWELIEVSLHLKYKQSKPNFLLIAFLSPQMERSLKIARTLYKVLRDVAIFMFFFVLTHILWQQVVLENFSNANYVDTFLANE